MIFYTVKSGDTVSSIARAYGVSPQRIIFDNGLENVDRPVVGQTILILEPETVYTVQRGDTLYSIAQRYSTTVGQLLRNNPFIMAPDRLEAGQNLVISFKDKPTAPLRINGYAYPFISIPLLRRTLPFLSTITIFGYGFYDSGELLAPNDMPLLEQARLYGVAPILLLTSILENGNFSSERSSLLFNNLMLQNTVLNNLVQVMNEKGYKGLDIDFEFVAPEDKDAFIRFIENATEIMHENGFFVNVDLAPKASADQRGLLYEAHDYSAIGAIADTVFLMTYEWGYTYGPPMAVAPINQVRRIVDYALTEIDREKILLGIPNYAYDWTLPFEKGISKAVTIGNQYAINLAGRANTEILFDEVSKTPFFYYRDQGRDHVVWFEDARSINVKLDVALQNSLRGIGYWNIMRPFAQNLALLSVRVIPEKV